jgi:hypothetical protein
LNWKRNEMGQSHDSTIVCLEIGYALSILQQQHEMDRGFQQLDLNLV